MKKILILMITSVALFNVVNLESVEAKEKSEISYVEDDTKIQEFDKFISKYRSSIPDAKEVKNEKIGKSKISIITKDLIWNGSFDIGNNPKKLVLHHLEASRENGNIRVEEINEWHKSNGWAGIGYHFYINKKGEIYRGRPEEAIGAHAYQHNVDTLGIAVEGRYQIEQMPNAQREAVILLGQYLRQKYDISIINKHKDLVSTDCPGENFPFDYIKNNILSESINKDGIYKIEKRNGKMFFVDTWTGEIQNGKVNYKGSIYNTSYNNGIEDKGWVNIDNKWYYFNSDSTFSVGWQLIGDKWYYFDYEGIMQTGWRFLGENWYYFHDSGRMAVGWQMIDGVWYYLEESGRMATGWKFINENWYYLHEWGAMATGWLDLNERKYYLYEWGAMATGWLNLDGIKYYLNSSGEVTTGWQYIDENWYYMYWDGVMAKNTIIGNWKIDSNGIATII
ncbi:N-acetylmuramoyl-L-alanine amidase [Clostridium thermobutyricum]|uniref:N-acetylmuramoyl-L-alanine amidase n=1 Tax=Clostridium thermobutyricum TaxID=29372 RepID=UPI002942CF99|nr:N-acetylmuramoyl-L-alanine amidase [Clostridium thermobutyricum]